MSKKKFISLISLFSFVQTLVSCDPVDTNLKTTSSITNISGDQSTNKEETSSSSTIYKSYKVIFRNTDAKVLLTTKSNEQGKVEYTGDTPTSNRAQTAFDGWIIEGGDGRVYSNDELPIIKKDTVFIAHYYSIKARFKVRFERDDGTLIEEREFEEGTMAKPSQNQPTKEETDEFKYTFIRWNRPFTKVTENTIYVANFKEEKKKYTITFLDGDGSVLTTLKYDYGTNNLATTIENLNLKPTKEETEGKKFNFANQWVNKDNNQLLDDNTILKSDCTYMPVFGENEKTYQVTFKYKDGSFIKSIGNNGVVSYKYNAEIVNIPTPTKESTAQYEYTFTGWDRAFEKVTENTTYVANFDQKPRKYKVRFFDYDGSLLEEKEVAYGTNDLKYTGSITPSKPSSNDTTYKFKNWKNKSDLSVGLQPVTGAVDYIPLFDDETRYYTITFDVDGKLTKKTYRYNDTPSISNPVKESTVAEDFTFIGWDSEITAVTGDKKYTAKFKSSPRKYLVTYKYDNGSVIYTEQVEYNKTPTYNGVPTKDPDVQNTYTFSGWGSDFNNPIKEDKTFIALFDHTPRRYTVTFLDYDGRKIDSGEYIYGATVIPPQNPSRESTAEFTYSFKGWDKEVSTVKGNTIYRATYNENRRSYTIRFLDGDGNELQSISVAYGTLPRYSNSKVPTKASTAEFNYTFDNTWSPSITTVTGEKTYIANFTPTRRSYKVRFVNYDKTLIKEFDYVYGQTVTDPKLTPIRPNEGNVSYTFFGWDQSYMTVTGDITYTAQYTSTITTFEILFVDGNGKIIARKNYSKGEIPSYDGIPTKASTAEWDYKFVKWDHDFSPVTSNETYTAVFEPVKRSYTIKFINDDGSILQSSIVEYGQTPKYTGNIPTKENTAQYTYSFKGWDKEISSVTGEKEYKAVYTATTNSYKITFVDGNNIVIYTETVEYGQTPSYNGTPTKAKTIDKEYIFTGWDSELTAVTGGKTYFAQFKEVPRKYTVTFLNDDGSILETKQVEYGTVPTYTGPSITKPSTAKYDYTFKDWDTTLELVKGDQTYKATYNESIRKYIVTFIRDDGSRLQTYQKVKYGEKATFNGTPSKNPEGDYKFEFSYWKDGKNPNDTIIYGDTEFVAVFLKIDATTVKITFLNDDNTLFREKYFKIGSEIVMDEIPTKECSEIGYEYVFLGWTPSLTTATKETTYIAQFEKQIKKFTVKFVDQFGEPIAADQKVEYNGFVKSDSKISNPKKASTAEWEFDKGYWSGFVDVLKTAITEDTVFVYNFYQSKRRYKITFIDGDGSVTSSYFEYGVTPNYGGTPTKTVPPANNSLIYEYEFLGWSPELKEVTGEATYTALFSELKKKKTDVTFELDVKTYIIPDVEYLTDIYTLVPEFSKDKESENTFEYRWQYDAIYLDGNTNNAKLEPNTMLMSRSPVYKAVWDKLDRKYSVTFTDSDTSNVPLTGCDEFVQNDLGYSSYIKRPTYEPVLSLDRYGSVVNEPIGWLFSFKVEGSSTYLYKDIKSFDDISIEYITNFYGKYIDQQNEIFNFKIVPFRHQHGDVNMYDSYIGNACIFLGSYPQSLADGFLNSYLEEFDNGIPNDANITYNADLNYYELNNNKYYKIVYDGPEGPDYYLIRQHQSGAKAEYLKKGKSYFFQIRPVLWRRRIDEKLTGGKIMLVADTILDYVNYFDPSLYKIKNSSDVLEAQRKMGAPSNYSQSNLRAFLNGKFYNELFKFEESGPVKQKDAITYKVGGTINSIDSMGATNSNVSLDNAGDINPTQDKIFPMSYQEANKFFNLYYDSSNEDSWSLYNFHETESSSSKKLKIYEATDYAKFKYFCTFKNYSPTKFNEYYLRSPGLQYNKNNKSFSINYSQVAVARNNSQFITLNDVTNKNGFVNDRIGSDSQGYYTYDVSNYASGVVPAVYASYAFWSRVSGEPAPWVKRGMTEW